MLFLYAPSTLGLTSPVGAPGTIRRRSRRSSCGYKRERRFRLHAFVLMPEHVHLLITPAPSITLERALQLIKGGYSHAFGIAFRRGEVWQRGFTDHRIRDAEDFAH